MQCGFIKKVTIFVGPNSAGKSSIIKSLLAFKQTFEDQSDHSGLLSRGEYVDLGLFSEYVRDHIEKDTCHFIFRLTFPQISRMFPAERLPKYAYIEMVYERDPGTGHGRLKSYIVNFDKQMNNAVEPDDQDMNSRFVSYTRLKKPDESYKPYISPKMFEYISKMPNVRSLIREMTSVKHEELNKTFREYKIQAQRQTQKGMISQIVRGSNIEHIRFMSFFENFLLSPLHANLFADLTEHLFALAALRDEPKRASARTDEKLSVGARGENTLSVFVNFQEQAQKATKKRSKSKNDFRRLLGWITRLKLGIGLETASWRDLLDLRIRTDRARRTHDSIVDLGVGFSQAFPILVQLGVAHEGSRLILEQPELHLYPWAQSELGKILCEESKNAGKNLVIETHSEHLITGMQAHISNYRLKGDEFLSKDDVQILFVSGDGSIEEMKLNEYGEFEEEWPPGFFDPGLTAYDEIIENKMR